MIWLCLGEYCGPKSIEAFVCYFNQWELERKKEREYRIYVTDALRIITENTSHLGGKFLTQRYADLGKVDPIPEQTGQEIAGGIIKGLTG